MVNINTKVISFTDFLSLADYYNYYIYFNDKTMYFSFYSIVIINIHVVSLSPVIFFLFLDV